MKSIVETGDKKSMEYKNIKTPQELYKFIKENIRYGFISSYNNKPYTRKELKNDELYEFLLFNSYFLQTPEMLLQTKIGLCYDQVELARRWFTEHNYQVRTYFSFYHNHAFLIYKDKEKYSLFERTHPKYNGIYTLNSKEEALKFYKCLQLEKPEELEIIEYKQPPFGIDYYSFQEYIKKEQSAKVYRK